MDFFVIILKPEHRWQLALNCDENLVCLAILVAANYELGCVACRECADLDRDEPAAQHVKTVHAIAEGVYPGQPRLFEFLTINVRISCARWPKY